MNCTFTSCWIIWPRLNVYGSYLIDVKVHQTEHLQTIKSSEWNVYIYIYIYIYTVFKLNVTVICAIPISSINALDWLLFFAGRSSPVLAEGSWPLADWFPSLVGIGVPYSRSVWNQSESYGFLLQISLSFAICTLRLPVKPFVFRSELLENRLDVVHPV